MHHITASCVILAICSNAVSQSRYSPHPRYETVAGYQSDYPYAPFPGSYLFGIWSRGRHQIGDGNFHNVMPLVKSISYRPIGAPFSYDSFSGAGRSWANVTLDMSSTEFKRMASPSGAVWTMNVTTKPVRVFSGAVSWPTLTGVLGNTITSWNQHQFAFQSSWVRFNAGALDDDILADFQFSGGTLANKARWPVGSAHRYYLDGYSMKYGDRGVSTTHYDGSTNGCLDTKARPTFGRAYGTMWTYNSGPLDVNGYPGRVQVVAHGHNLGRLTTVVCNLGFALNSSGIHYGAGCDKLFVAGPIARFAMMTDDFGRTGPYSFGVKGGWIKFHPIMSGLHLVTQWSWQDTGTKADKISSANDTTIPSLGFRTLAETKRWHVTGSGVNTRAGGVFGSNHSSYTPVCKYN